MNYTILLYYNMYILYTVVTAAACVPAAATIIFYSQLYSTRFYVNRFSWPPPPQPTRRRG